VSFGLLKDGLSAADFGHQNNWLPQQRNRIDTINTINTLEFKTGQFNTKSAPCLIVV
jgi:hypothetical protein